VTLQRSVVDSSGWIELFTDGPQADRFLTLLQAESAPVIPAISILEVFKWILREHSEAQAIEAVAVRQRHSSVTPCACRWPTASSSLQRDATRRGSTPWTQIFRVCLTWS
jgi:uncharacterized protein with PIN domain